MGQTGPSPGFLERVFGQKKKKGEDINLPSPAEERASDRAGVEAAMSKPRLAKPIAADDSSEEDSGSIFSRVKKAKKKYNPFDAYVKATGGD